MENVRSVLSEYDLDLSDVVKVGAYVHDPADLAEFGSLHRDHFTPPLPARTTVTGCLTGRSRFELDVVAQFPPSSPGE